MATVSKDQHGSPRIQFKVDSRRRTLYLGAACSPRAAQVVAAHIEALVANRSGLSALPPTTVTWLKSCGPELKKKLLKAGLIDASARAVPKVKDWIDTYIVSRTDIVGRTRDKLRHAGRLLVDYFGEGKRIDAITVNDAEGFVRDLAYPKKKGVKPMDRNTTRRMAGRAKQIWLAAIRAELITKNPFEGIVSTVTPNRSRDFFVEPALFEKLLTGCPDVEWEALLVLARFGGLRTPSESSVLKWGDIDFKAETLKVSNVKTVKSTGEAFRVLPLFPEVRAALERLTPGKPDEFIIRKHRGENLRTELSRIAKKAGIEIWQKPFQNLRMSRASELMAAGFPAFVVCHWLGHSEEVARSFYWRESKQHHEAAVGKKRKGDQVTQSVTHTSPSFDPSLRKPWSWTYDIPRETMTSPGIKLAVPKGTILPS